MTSPTRATYSIVMLAACPFPANYGSPASIKEMSQRLVEMGHRVHIVTYPFGDDLPVTGPQIHRIFQLGWSRQIKVGPTLQKPFLDILMVFYACRVIWKYQCDIIHSHNYEGQLVGICSRLLTGRPLLYNAVNTMSDELPTYNFIQPAFLARWLAGFLDWLAPQFTNHITAISSDLRDGLIQRGVPPEKVTLIPSGIHPEMFEHADSKRFRKELGLGDVPVVLYAGTIDSFQRLDLMVEAFARVVAKFPEAILLIVCPFTHPEQRHKLVEQADGLGIGNKVRWVDSHPLADLPDYLAVADVAVVPRPQCPGLPLKLFNYMGAARPIVVSAGGARGIRHLQNGFIFRDRNVDHMAEGISTLLQDRTLAERLGHAARQTILEEYDWKILCRKIELIYDNLMARNQGRS